MTLETLLNKLIELGWKPRGDNAVSCLEADNKFIVIDYQFDVGTKSLNDLCSIDSGLWQFVCEKGLYKKEIEKHNEEEKNILIDGNLQRKEYEDEETCLDYLYKYMKSDYRYRLMLSSIQTNKEKFLLENIKIDD